MVHHRNSLTHISAHAAIPSGRTAPFLPLRPARAFRLLAPVLLGLFVVILSGCQTRERELTGVSLTTSTAEGSPFPVQVTDRLKRTVEFASPPRRIVSVTPSLTEIVFAIRADSRLVGVTDYCNHPPGARDKTSVGGGVGSSLNREILLSLEPDLVLAKWDTHEDLIQQLQRLNIPVLALGAESFVEMCEEIRILGQLTEQSLAAGTLVTELSEQMSALQESVRQKTADRRVRVFYQVWDDPLMSVGRESFIGQLLTMAGSENILEHSSIRYPQVSLESVLAADPEVIIAPSSQTSPISVESILHRRGWERLSAIRNGRIHLVDGDRISRCGPRMPEALAELIEAIHGPISAGEQLP